MRGSTITKAAEAAGVARETVSRWSHHDPVFIAELHNFRADLAAQTRYALESLGMRAVAALCEALQDQSMRPTRLRAACAVLKLIGADRAETLAPTTAHEVNLRLCEREIERLERQAALEDIVKSSQQAFGVSPHPEPVCTTMRETKAQDSGEADRAGEWLDETCDPDGCASATPVPAEPETEEPAVLTARRPAPDVASEKPANGHRADRPRAEGQYRGPELAWTCTDPSRGAGVRHSAKRVHGRVADSCGATADVGVWRPSPNRVQQARQTESQCQKVPISRNRRTTNMSVSIIVSMDGRIRGVFANSVMENFFGGERLVGLRLAPALVAKPGLPAWIAAASKHASKA